MFARAKKRPSTPSPSQMLGDFISMLEEKTGHRLDASEAVIREGETFRAWCERLAKGPDGDGKNGLKVDGKPFRLDDRPAMAWVYEQIPSTEDEAFRLILVLMKCAQVGFTVMEMLACIYLGLRFGPATVGMFLPDMNLAGVKSTERFMPVVRSVPDVHDLMTQDAPDGSGRKTGEGNVNRRRIGDALFIFSWTSGRATTESIPMDVLSFDEVQEMTIEQMEKTLERLSASDVRFTLMGSTANWPDADIDWWFKRGSRRRFHTRCPTCGKAEPIDDYFPNCFKWLEERRAYAYTCRAGHVIDDPQVGEWVAENPEADPPVDTSIPKKFRPLRIRSIHFPQFLSPTIAPGEIFDAYRYAESMKNFYNRKLGKPYTDPSQVPVTLEHLHACEAAGIAAGLQWKKSAPGGTFMGIDQMGNHNVHVIKERMPDGRQATIHLEMTFSADPFERSSELMRLYNIQCCVVEINPNYNDAKKFANRHPGRVFICDSFGNIAEGMVQWGDAPRLDTSDRRTSEEARDRYTLRMDQYKCMQVSMFRFVNGLCLFPDRKGLEQDVIEAGQTIRKQIAPVAWHHFTKTALVVEKDEKDGTNKVKRRVQKIGIDPHFSYANMLCDVAWSRAYGTSTFVMPDTSGKEIQVKKAEDMGMHGLPTQVASMIEIRPVGMVCGRCTAFDDSEGTQAGQGMCAERAVVVNSRDPACPLWDEVSS